MFGQLFNPWKRLAPDNDSDKDSLRGVHIIAGLGNPGSKYEKTRHNIGFTVLDQWTHQESVKFTEKREWKTLFAELRYDGQRVILLKPLTFMNNSGESLHAVQKWFKVRPEHIMVLVDDTALPPGQIRFRSKGSSGGHNGLKSIIQHVGTEQFARGRIGIGNKPHPQADLADFVLGQFAPDEIELMTQKVIPDVIAGVKMWIGQGIEKTMNQYNQSK
ncbi:MAG: aminoacyl-tRNA hydrolase [Verrucomicrobiota bacterium]|nr:aminoacyl-tRNA hydrolase [Verrucomicrobiota bacterium]